MKNSSPKCKTRGCRNPKTEGRNYCCKCRTREWRRKNPLKNKFNHKKAAAKEKGVPFTITFDDLVYIDSITPLLSGYEIDRIIPAKGYVPGNIQILIKRDNIAKGNRERRGQGQLF